MENPNNIHTYLSEEILTEIFAKLPLRSIYRFKSVCRAWKSAIESLYFRRLFVSLHQNISTPWSLLLNDREFIHYHGCETLGLPKSLGSYIPKIRGVYTNVETSNGLVLIDGYMGVSYVGNPILQQWIEVPYPSSSASACSSLSSLVTRVDEDGVVLSFKLIRGKRLNVETDQSSVYLHFCVYSSETGNWTRKKLHCPHYFRDNKPPMTFHGTFYISPSEYNNEVLIAHDFYDESNVCQVIPLPDNDSRTYFKSALTTSTRFVMYIKTLDYNVLKVWRLLNNDDDSAWEFVSEISLVFIDITFDDNSSTSDDSISTSDDSISTFDENIINYVPLTMHPYDLSIVYLWNLDNKYLVSCNLETQDYQIFNDQSVDDDDLHVNYCECKKHMNIFEGLRYNKFQYVLPRWMTSIPRPPQTKIIDTASLINLAQEKT